MSFKLANNGKTVYCEICKIFIQKADAKTHFTGKKHFKRLNANKIAKLIADNSEGIVYVSNLPYGLLEAELTNHFKMFGSVRKIEMLKGGALGIVRFATVVDFHSIFSRRHVFRGKEISVSDSIPPSEIEEEFCTLDEDITKGRYIYEEVKDISPIDAQIAKVLELLSLTDENLSERIELVDYLSQQVKEFFPGGWMELMGSSVNRLGFRGSEAHLTFFLPTVDPAEIIQMDRNEVPSCEDVRSGKFAKKDLALLNKAHLFRFIWKLIERLPCIKEIHPFSTSHLPVLKFQYTSPQGTRLCGDISFRDRRGVLNSHLLGVYDRLDPRVHSILMILRFWAHREGFVGKFHRFHGYAFHWLVIFYLMSVDLVPTVDVLSSLASKQIIIGNWDCSFCEDTSKVSVGARRKTVVDLLIGFFGFYATFDFETNVICPRDGTVVLKTKLVELAGEQLDFKITDLSIQDPFDLSFNITTQVSSNHVQSFMFECGRQYLFWKAMESKRKFNLTPLFYPRVVPTPVPQNPNHDESPAYLFISLKENNLNYSFKNVCNVVLEIFKNILLFGCSVTPCSPPKTTDESVVCDKSSSSKRTINQNQSDAKRQKTSDSSKSTSDEPSAFHVAIDIYYRVWQNRNEAESAVTVPPHSTWVELQEKISLQLAKNQPKRRIYNLESVFSLWQQESLMVTFFRTKKHDSDFPIDIIPFIQEITPKLALGFLQPNSKPCPNHCL